jgi:fructosamine-3-kinase
VNVREALLQEKIDPALTPETLSRIASRARNAPTRVSSWQPLAGGCWNRVVGFRGSAAVEALVMKIAPNAGDAGLSREHEVLQWFIQHTKLPVPAPVLYDGSGADIPGSFIVMQKVPGKPLHQVHHLLGAGDRRRTTVQIAEDMAALHQQTGQGFGGVELREEDRTDWPSFWCPRFDAVFAEAAAAGHIPADFLSRIETLRPRFPQLLEIGRKSTLTHYDIWSGNIMIEAARGVVRVSGYIDVPGFWADPVRELSFAEMFGVADALFYEVYTSVHALPEGWRVRRDLYNLKMNLKHIVMYPQEGFYRQGAARCLGTLEHELL